MKILTVLMTSFFLFNCASVKRTVSNTKEKSNCCDFISTYSELDLLDDQGTIDYFYIHDDKLKEGLQHYFKNWNMGGMVNTRIQELMRQQAPVFIVEKDLSRHDLAVVVSKQAKAADVLLEKIESQKSYVLILQDNAGPDEFIHESQHWLDANDTELFKKTNKIREILKNQIPSRDLRDLVFRAIWEWRGYAAQWIFLKANKAVKAHVNVVNVFRGSYYETLSQSIADIRRKNPGAWKELKSILKELEINGSPVELSFVTLFSKL